MNKLATNYGREKNDKINKKGLEKGKIRTDPFLMTDNVMAEHGNIGGRA